jgi:hypothetical protein
MRVLSIVDAPRLPACSAKVVAHSKSVRSFRLMASLNDNYAEPAEGYGDGARKVDLSRTRGSSRWYCGTLYCIAVDN